MPFTTRVRSTWVRVCDSKRDRYWQSESNTMSIASLKITSHNGISVLTIFLPSRRCLKYTWLTWELSDHWCYPKGCQPFSPRLVILHSDGGSSNERRYAIPSPAITASFQMLDGTRSLFPRKPYQTVGHTTLRPLWKWWSGSKRQWQLDDWWSFVAYCFNIGLIGDGSFDPVSPLYTDRLFSVGGPWY